MALKQRGESPPVVVHLPQSLAIAPCEPTEGNDDSTRNDETPLDYTHDAETGKRIIETLAGHPQTRAKGYTVGWKWRHSSLMFGVLWIGRGADGEDYFVERQTHSVFRFTKLLVGCTTSYVVMHDSNKHLDCACHVFAETGTCKHAEALRSLAESGDM